MRKAIGRKFFLPKALPGTFLQTGGSRFYTAAACFIVVRPAAHVTRQ